MLQPASLDDRACYYSDSPLIAVYLEECRSREAAFVAAAEELVAEFPGFCGVKTTYPHRVQLTGLAPTDTSHAAPGSDWCREAGSWFWRPRRNTKSGKLLAKRFYAVQCSTPPLPGMPADLLDAQYVRRFPRLQASPPVYWVAWNASASLVESDPAFDRSLWTLGKFSAYYQALEHAAETAPVGETARSADLRERGAV